MDCIIYESARSIPVCDETDVCVAGGSCTGVFAAVRAARLGCKVTLCEETNCLGGVAVNGLVNIWHSLYNTDNNKQVIAGLTAEVLERLELHGSLIKTSRFSYFNFNPAELTFELDALIEENKINVRFHTKVCQTVSDGENVDAVIIEDSDGRKAIKAKFFIDCTGDGDLAARLGLESFTNEYIQPPSACYHLMGNVDGIDLGKLLREHGAEVGLDDDWGWSDKVAGCPGLTLRVDNHVFGVRCDRADDLTKAEQTGRRQMRAFLNLLKKYGRNDTVYAITNFASYIGVRETVHYKTKFKAEVIPLLSGHRYSAPILNGTYPTDIHHSEDKGITFRCLDGSQTIEYGKNKRTVKGNWRDELHITTPPATYYQLPFDVLVQEKLRNFICAGRMLNADMGAFGALRVMVNLNQLGEAAGCAAAHCLDTESAVYEIDGSQVSEKLRKGGSAL